MPNRSTELQKKPSKKKYVSPAIVDYGSVTKITATQKAISGSDAPGVTKKGTCL
jgi:hypothetical protein